MERLEAGPVNGAQVPTRISSLVTQSRLIAAALLGATAATSALVSADDYTWSGTTSNNWEVSTNWTNTDNVLEPGIDDGTIPDGITDSATIANPDALLLANRTIGALTIQNNGDVLTGTGGAKSLRGHQLHADRLRQLDIGEVVVVGDLDEPGQQGAAMKAAWWSSRSFEARTLLLPGEMETGRDFHDHLFGL